MPSLPQRKVGIVACSGEELPEGTVTRLAALKVLEELRPNDTVTICLPLFLAGGEGDRAFAKFYPTIAVDGCEKRCSARAPEQYSHKPAVRLPVDDILAGRRLPRPQGLRAFPNGQAEASLAPCHADTVPERSGVEAAEESLPAQLLDTMKLYNPIPPGDETLYTQAVALARQSYCAAKEQTYS